MAYPDEYHQRLKHDIILTRHDGYPISPCLMSRIKHLKHSTAGIHSCFCSWITNGVMWMHTNTNNICNSHAQIIHVHLQILGLLITYSCVNCIKYNVHTHACMFRTVVHIYNIIKYIIHELNVYWCVFAKWGTVMSNTWINCIWT